MCIIIVIIMITELNRKFNSSVTRHKAYMEWRIKWKYYRIRGENIVIIAILAAVIVSIIVAAYICISSSRRCTLEVQAQFIKFNYYYATKGQGRFCPVFRYVYNGMTYERQSPAGWTERNRPVLYAGKIYIIRINPEKPEQIYIDKKQFERA